MDMHVGIALNSLREGDDSASTTGPNPQCSREVGVEITAASLSENSVSYVDAQCTSRLALPRMRMFIQSVSAGIPS